MRTIAGAAVTYFVVTLVATLVAVGVLALTWGFYLGSKYGAQPSELDGPLIILMASLPISWTVCRLIIRRFAVPASLGPRLAVGTLAFALMILADVANGVWVNGETISQHLADYASPPDQAGLLGHIAFGLFPVIQLRIPRRASHE